MAEFDNSHQSRVASKDWHPNACVQLNMEPPKKSSFYGWNPNGPVLPARSIEEKVRIKEVKRELRGIIQSEEQVVFVHGGVPEDIKFGSPIPNPNNKLPNEALRDYLDGLSDDERQRYVKYQRKIADHYSGPGGP